MDGKKNSRVVNLEPCLHKQFLCDKFTWQIYLFVYLGQQIIVDNWQLSGSRMPLDSRDKSETRRDCLVVLQWRSVKGRSLPHFTWRVVYTSNFSYVTTFIYHIKDNTPALQQIQLSHKNWSNFLVYASKLNLSHKNCSCKQGLSVNISFGYSWNSVESG